MGWPKGKTRPPNSGRQKGTKNVRTLAFAETLATIKNDDGKVGFDPVRELVECYHRTCNEDGQMGYAIDCLKAMLPYVYSKVTPEESITANDRAILDRIKELANKPKQEIIDITEAGLKKL